MKCKLISVALLGLLFSSRLYFQPFYSLISDCDETFNYWEPLNFLVRSFGKQTWEYSPEYAIRSWALLLPFSTILTKSNELFNLEPSSNFYMTRCILGLFSFLMEYKLYKAIKKTLSLKIANLWLIFQIFNPGYFHASVELLPSSIAMILQMGTIAHTLNYLSTDLPSSFIYSVIYNFAAGIFGWPFVMVLSVPSCIHYLFTHRMIITLRTVYDCLLMILLVGAIVIGIDSLFYGKFTPVSWNILMYNVINADEESGPNIFGTEPWSYYIINLILNFPLPTLLFAFIGIFHFNLLPLWTSLLLWLSIFIAQPHKEERFLYPIYGLISLSASIGFYKFCNLFNFNKFCKRCVQLCFIIATVSQAVSRTLALIDNYTAPISVYYELSKLDTPTDVGVINVCTGREWYHFPNSFLLPDEHRLRFVQSGFDGLLPGDFLETGSLLKAVRSVPTGMNNMNLFDEGKLIDINECHYFVEIDQPSDGQDVFTFKSKGWEKIFCKKFIDAESSRILGRVFYIPETWVRFSEHYVGKYLNKLYSAKYNDYCLFKKIDNVETVSEDNIRNTDT